MLKLAKAIKTDTRLIENECQICVRQHILQGTRAHRCKVLSHLKTTLLLRQTNVHTMYSQKAMTWLIQMLTQ